MNIPNGTRFKHTFSSTCEWEIYDQHIEGDYSVWSTGPIGKSHGSLHTNKDRSLFGPLIITYLPNATKLEKLIYNIP